MAERDFFESSARDRAAKATRAVETGTSAELVIVVRRTSASYAATAIAVGAAAGIAALAALIYSPQSFAAEAMPLDVTIAVAVGYGLSATIAPLRRLLTRTSLLNQCVDTAAKSAFYDLGITKTQRRQGILVFASLFEGRARVLPDVAVDKKALGGALEQIETRLSHHVRSRNFSGFIAEIEAMGPTLAAAMPRHAGDTNELPDEMQ